MMRGAFPLLAVVLVAAPAAAGPIQVKSVSIDYFSASDPGRASFGTLTFRGGLVLTSEDKDFGGISGARLTTGGALTAVSDRGNWITGRVVYDGTRPVGVEDAALDPVRGANGKKLTGSNADAESLETADGSAWLGTERRHQVLRFDLSKGVADAKGAPVALPKEAKSFPYNGGIEGLGLVPGGVDKGTLLIVSEEAHDAAGNHIAFLLPGRTKKPSRALSLKRRDNYAVTDLAFLPGGDLVVLERRYAPPFSLSMRLRRIAQSTIAENAVLDGEVLLEASFPIDRIDNMEALATHRAADGASVLTLISDDNFSQRQRTLLLQFAVPD